MNYTEKTKPGMGDPYWYEWSVGEQQIINMLNEDNNIEYVELQANVGLGLDDVVVTYSDGRVLCIQVKHTRANDTLTFADLVYSAKKTSKSLLAELADSWQEESRKYTEVVPQVFTNRRKGQVSSSTKGEEKFVRPALDVFWKKLSEKIKFAKNFEDIIFEEYPEAWNEWKTQLSGIQSNDDKLKFLRLLQLETEQKDLQEIENEVLSHLSIAFRITLDDADKLLGKLDHALRKWTTSVRNTSRIYQETYDKAQRMRKRVSPRRNSEKPAHRLSGLLYCADCGSRLAYINSKPKDGKIYDSNQAFRCSRYHNKYHSCTGHYIKASTIEMLIYQATKRVSQYVLKDEKEFVEQLKAQYELQCEKDNTDDKKELLEAKRRMMDLDDLIKGLYENFTLGRLPERQFNRLMTEYDTEQSSLEQRISELETATERISTKAVQIDKFVRLVKKYRDFEELTTPMLNDFIEKVVIHEAEGGRTKDRTQQVDIYFNFIGNFVLPLSEDEVEALQSEEARRAEEIAERKRKSSKKSTQKRNQKRAEIKAKAEAGDPEAMAEYKAILEKGRQNNRKRSEKMRELRMSDPEYRAKMEEKERLALEREKKRQERATKKKKIALAELKEQAEKGNQEAVRELEESRAIARERSRKSAEKRKQRAENDPEYAKYLEERNAEYNRRHTARRKEQMEALRARAEAGDQEAKSQLAERKQYQVRATVKSYRKMREDALNGDPIAKERYEKTLAMRREAYHAKKSEQTA